MKYNQSQFIENLLQDLKMISKKNRRKGKAGKGNQGLNAKNIKSNLNKKQSKKEANQ
jgi:hypothetical protein